MVELRLSVRNIRFSVLKALASNDINSFPFELASLMSLIIRFDHEKISIITKQLVPLLNPQMKQEFATSLYSIMLNNIPIEDISNEKLSEVRNICQKVVGAEVKIGSGVLMADYFFFNYGYREDDLKKISLDLKRLDSPILLALPTLFIHVKQLRQVKEDKNAGKFSWENNSYERLFYPKQQRLIGYIDGELEQAESLIRQLLSHEKLKGFTDEQLQCEIFNQTFNHDINPEEFASLTWQEQQVLAEEKLHESLVSQMKNVISSDNPLEALKHNIELARKLELTAQNYFYDWQKSLHLEVIAASINYAVEGQQICLNQELAPDTSLKDHVISALRGNEQEYRQLMDSLSTRQHKNKPR